MPTRRMPAERCDCYHIFVAKNGAVYSGMRCSRTKGHKGRCKWASIWYNWCDYESRNNANTVKLGEWGQNGN